MRKKIYIAGMLILAAAMTGCSGATPTVEYKPGTIDDPIKLMEVKREYYKQQEIAKKKAEEEAKKAAEKAKIEEQKRLEAEKQAKIEAEKKAEEERLRNMTPEEKLKYKMESAMKQVQEMNEIVDKARAEEIENTKSLEHLDQLLQNN